MMIVRIRWQRLHQHLWTTASTACLVCERWTRL